MSLATTLSRAVARAARENWDDHKHGCPACDRWAYRRTGEGCAVGRTLRADHLEAARIHRENLAADRLPAGMEPMF